MYELGYLYGWMCAILSDGEPTFYEWKDMPLIPFMDAMSSLVKSGEMPPELDARLGTYLAGVDVNDWNVHLHTAVPIESQGSLLIGFSKGRKKAAELER